MTTQTSSLSNPASQKTPSLLRRALLGDVVFSGLSGLFLVLDAKFLANFLGLENPVILAVTGAIVILYALFVFWLANRTPIPRLLAWSVIELNVLWVIGSAVLIFSNLVPLTVPGKWAIAITADIVMLLAIVQYLGLRRQ